MDDGTRMADGGGVRVEVVELEAGTRQIRTRTRATQLLRERREDLRAAIAETSDIAQTSLAALSEAKGWKVSSLEATFGLTLAAEGGIIVSKASAEASFELKITIVRD